MKRLQGLLILTMVVVLGISAMGDVAGAPAGGFGNDHANVPINQSNKIAGPGQFGSHTTQAFQGSQTNGQHKGNPGSQNGNFGTDNFAKTGGTPGGDNKSPTFGNNFNNAANGNGANTGVNPGQNPGTNPNGNHGINPPGGNNGMNPGGSSGGNPGGNFGGNSGSNPGGHAYKPEGKTWTPAKPVGKPVAPVGKSDWNHGWLHPWNGGWKQPSQTTTIVNVWDNYGYGMWPSGMDNEWFWNWNFYAPNSGVYVLGVFDDPNYPNYAQIVLCNPSNYAQPIGSWQFIVDGSLYAFQSDAWIAAHSTAMLEVPIRDYSTIQVLDGSYNIAAQFEWQGKNVMLGSDGEVYQSNVMVDTFGMHNGLYETSTMVMA